MAIAQEVSGGAAGLRAQSLKGHLNLKNLRHR